MNIECKKCGRVLSGFQIGQPNRAWDLLYMGTFCRDCALYVLAFWTINAAPALERLQADVSQDQGGES